MNSKSNVTLKKELWYLDFFVSFESLNMDFLKIIGSNRNFFQFFDLIILIEKSEIYFNGKKIKTKSKKSQSF